MTTQEFFKIKRCPVCGDELIEETKEFYDYWTGITDEWGTGKYYCPNCKKIEKKKLEEQAQKRYEQECKKYDLEYQEYLKIRQHDNIYDIKLTMKEIEALRKLVNTNDRFKDYDIHHAYETLTQTYLNSKGNTVTPKQNNVIKLIEKNTTHKFYGKTLESAREFISKYISESKKEWLE